VTKEKLSRALGVFMMKSDTGSIKIPLQNQEDWLYKKKKKRKRKETTSFSRVGKSKGLGCLFV